MITHKTPTDMKAWPILLFLLLATLIATTAGAQDGYAAAGWGRHKNIYYQFRGDQLYRGVHYDQRFKRGQLHGLGFRAGVGSTRLRGIWSDRARYQPGLTTFPVGLNVVGGPGPGSFVAEGGILPAFATGRFAESAGNNRIGAEEGFSMLGAYGKLGYRWQPVRSGVFFELQYTRTYFQNGRVDGFIGISVGVGFK